MTEPSTQSPDLKQADEDEGVHEFAYGHGRMPFFMKVVWVGFLIFATWYTVAYLLTALGEEVGG